MWRGSLAACGCSSVTGEMRPRGLRSGEENRAGQCAEEGRQGCGGTTDASAGVHVCVWGSDYVSVG
eukprot:2979605-Pleurochrysis_carterae.AAC.1